MRNKSIVHQPPNPIDRLWLDYAGEIGPMGRVYTLEQLADLACMQRDAEHLRRLRKRAREAR